MDDSKYGIRLHQNVLAVIHLLGLEFLFLLNLDSCS